MATPKHVLLAAVAAAALQMTGCGGSTTKSRDPAMPPPPAPNADVGQSRAERDAAIASGPRMETQKRTEDAAREPPQ